MHEYNRDIFRFVYMHAPLTAVSKKLQSGSNSLRNPHFTTVNSETGGFAPCKRNVKSM